MTDTIRIALAPEVTRDDVETAAWDLNLFISNRTEATKDQPREDIWRTRDEKCWLHEIEDHIIGLRYLVVNGQAPDKLESELRKRLKTVTHTEALMRLKAAQTRDDTVLALYQLGISAPTKVNKPILNALKAAALDNPDEKLRQSAVLAMAYAGWPEFRATLEEISQQDASATVRSTATGALKAEY